MKDPVLIKSNKYGITLWLDRDMPYRDLLLEIRARFEAASHFFDHAGMAVEFEGRTLTEEEERLLVETIEEAAGIHILCIIEKNTYTEQIHKKMLDESLSEIHERDGQFYRGTLRGRQILESETSIVIIGDVEEGAKVASKGSVVVTGTIYGTVIAGAAGDDSAVIAALHMSPKKLRIGDAEVKPNVGGSLSWAKLS